MAWPDTPITTPDFVPGYVNEATLEQKVTDRLNLLVGRVGVYGPFVGTSGVVYDIATGGTMAGYRIFSVGPLAYIFATWNAPAVTGNSTGDIANLPAMQISDSELWPVYSGYGVASGNVGPDVGWAIGSNGQIALAKLPPGVSLTAGQQVSISGAYPLI